MTFAQVPDGDGLGISFAADIRTRTVLVRLGCIAAIGGLMATVGHWNQTGLWLCAYLLVQAVLYWRSRRPDPPIAFYAASFANYVVAGFPTWHLWMNCGDFGKVAATLFLCGMMIQLVTSCMGAKIMFWASATPLIAYLVVVPLAFFGRTRLVEGLAVAACVGLLLIYLTVLWIGQQRAFQALLEGRRQADKARFEAEGANQAKTDFLAVMSHEVRTPMNAVLGAARLLERDALSPQQAAHVAMICDAGQVLMDVLNDVLDLAKIEAGKLSISPEATGLRSLVRRCTETWRGPAQVKGLDFEVRVDEDVPEAVLIDGARTAQILFNLLSNAVKFTETGGIVVRVSARRASPLGAEPGVIELAFAVTDSGGGVAEHVHARLFTAFEQADNSISRRHGGTGLGLAISQRLAQMMGGEISVVSRQGAGSTFTLTLAVQEAALAAALPAAPAADLAPGASAGLRILVAEDNLANQRIVSLFLQPLEAEVTVVSNGIEALEALAATPFDLVLMDMQMPLMDGLEATRRLRASPGPNAAIPVIALTANVMEAQREACRQAGMDGHVAKPIDSAVLINAILEMTRGPSEPAAELIAAG